MERDADRETKRRLARLYAAKGQLIRDHPGAAWPASFAAQAFDRAVQLDAERSAYLVQRALARAQLPNPDWTAFCTTPSTPLQRANPIRTARPCWAWSTTSNARASDRRPSCLPRQMPPTIWRCDSPTNAVKRCVTRGRAGAAQPGSHGAVAYWRPAPVRNAICSKKRG